VSNFLIRTYRLASYRQWTLWIRGHLGKTVRQVIPSCVVKTIHHNYPQANGVYKGFEYAEWVGVKNSPYPANLLSMRGDSQTLITVCLTGIAMPVKQTVIKD